MQGVLNIIAKTGPVVVDEPPVVRELVLARNHESLYGGRFESSLEDRNCVWRAETELERKFVECALGNGFKSQTRETPRTQSN